MTELRERRQSGAVSVKRALIGRPRASAEMHETLLSKKLALPVFASDPLSSVAYATESALVVLVAASATAAYAGQSWYGEPLVVPKPLTDT